MKPESSFPHSQQLATCRYPEPEAIQYVRPHSGVRPGYFPSTRFFSVCEGFLGLSVLVSIVRSHGNDYFQCYSIFQFQNFFVFFLFFNSFVSFSWDFPIGLFFIIFVSFVYRFSFLFIIGVF
jgi:hypothetical protein